VSVDPKLLHELEEVVLEAENMAVQGAERIKDIIAARDTLDRKAVTLLLHVMCKHIAALSKVQRCILHLELKRAAQTEEKKIR
jgi:hypothetical protein